ncbi:FAR1 DNA binding domain, zinc finger, SWIM-type, MULE transposase domain containing protein [Tanacetum coccineum]
MGGYWVMVKFQSGEAKKTFQSNVGIGTWFAKIQQASTDLFVEGRVAWVDIEGVPLKIWSDNTFKRIASKWGTLIHVDSHEDGNFYTKRLCINTNITSNILESFKIIYRGKLFWVRAKEVPGWEPDFMEDNDDDSDNDDDLINDLKKMKKWKTHSEDPFNIYKLLTKNKENNHKEFNLEDSLKYPPGFTPINDNVNSEGQSNKFAGERLNNIQEEVLKDKFNEDAAESTCSGHFKKSNISREDNFKIVKVRDHVGFYVVGKDGTRLWYPDILAHGEKPIQGTQFVSIVQAYSFYVAYGKKARFDVRRGGEYKAVGFGDATTKYFHCTREGFLPNPKEKSGVKSLDVDISKHSEVSDGFERLMKQIHGGFDMVGVTVNDCKNQKKKISVFIGDRDAQMAVEKLLSDDDRYQMVFVPFTRINHHNHCITFASGFLADETVGAYIWLLKQFKEAFGTDPEVVVGAALCNRTNFKRRIYDIVWTNHISPKVFERKWECMINEFELGENKWLADMFDLRESWIHAYLKDVHMAGLMRTTSRSESENHLFGKWTSPHLTLIEFLSHYDTAIDYQRYIKRKNNHDSRYKTPAFKTDIPMEKEACKLYTRKLFFDVQDEMFASYKYCIALSIFESTIDRLVHDLDKLHIYKDKMKELLNQAEINVPPVPKVSSKAVMSAMLGVDEPDNVLIGNPNLRKVKGMGCFSRMKLVAEVIVEELAKSKTCSVCGGKEGHNKRTCTNEPASKKPKVQAAPKEKAARKQQDSQPRRFGLRSSTPKSIL